MELLLKQNKMWNMVSGTDTRPLPNDPPEAAWIDKDLTAQIDLLLNMGDNQVEEVRSLGSENAIWNHLKSLYEPTDLATKAYTLHAFIELKMKEEETATQFLQQWQRKLADVVLSSTSLDEDLKCTLLLGALPSSWAAFITTQSANQTPTLLQLINRVKHEELMQKSNNSISLPSSNAIIAYKSHPSQRSWPQRSPMRSGGMQFSRPFCSYCRKPGHSTNECRSKIQQNHKRPGYQRQKTQAHIVEECSHEENNYTDSYSDNGGYDDLLQSFVAQALQADIQPKSKGSNTWYFDTGGTHHLTHRCD